MYDLHKMLGDDKLSIFLNSGDFDGFICRVAQDDVASFRNNNEWLVHHPADSVIFANIE